MARTDAVREPLDGFQQRVAYWYKRDADDPGEPVMRIPPRGLMVPPGFPDFLTRQRTLDSASVEISGRAWSGAAPIVQVEFGVDGAWTAAVVENPAGPFASCRWSATWNAPPGEHVLSCRATDAAGDGQPTEQPWNYQGMGNNLTQTVPVLVR